MGGALTAGVAAGSDFAEEPGVGELHLGVAPPLDLGSQDGGISDLCTSWGAISHNKEIPAEIRYASRGSCQDGLAMHRKHGGWECGEAGGRRSIAAGGTLDPNDEAAHHDGARGGESEVSSHGEAGLPGQSKVFSTYISLWPFGKIEIYVEEDPEPRRRKVWPRPQLCMARLCFWKPLYSWVMGWREIKMHTTIHIPAVTLHGGILGRRVCRCAVCTGPSFAHEIF